MYCKMREMGVRKKHGKRINETNSLSYLRIMQHDFRQETRYKPTDIHDEATCRLRELLKATKLVRFTGEGYRAR